MTLQKVNLLREMRCCLLLLCLCGWALFSASPARALSTSTRSFEVTCYVPGQPLQVTVQVDPDPATEAWAAEDAPPLGWTVSDISPGGSYDGVNMMVKWGPFFDNSPRTLAYYVTPPADETGEETFAGQASFDGSNVPTAGSATLSPVPIADAGPDQTTGLNTDVQVGGNPTAGGGTGTYTIAWTFVANPGDAGTIDDPTAANPTFRATAAGTYVLQVQVTDDNTGCFAADQVTITVQGGSTGSGGGGTTFDPTRDRATTYANGTANLSVTDGRTSAEVRISDAPRGIDVQAQLSSNNDHGFAGIGPQDGAGVMPQTLTVDGDLEPGTFVAVIQICYDQADLDDAGLMAADLVIHAWDEQEDKWVPAGANNVGESEPTGNIGDYGWIDNCIWVVVDHFSDFMAADQCPDDPIKSLAGQCGCGMLDTDTDGDTAADCVDNCPDDPNADQTDTDGDGMGDICDNCPDGANADQGDSDADGIGDVCDACPNDADNDADGDGLCADVDNCPTTANSDQADTDGDGVGDACEPSSPLPVPVGQPLPGADGGDEDQQDSTQAVSPVLPWCGFGAAEMMIITFPGLLVMRFSRRRLLPL